MYEHRDEMRCHFILFQKLIEKRLHNFFKSIIYSIVLDWYRNCKWIVHSFCTHTTYTYNKFFIVVIPSKDMHIINSCQKCVDHVLVSVQLWRYNGVRLHVYLLGVCFSFLPLNSLWMGIVCESVKHFDVQIVCFFSR